MCDIIHVFLLFSDYNLANNQYTLNISVSQIDCYDGNVISPCGFTTLPTPSLSGSLCTNALKEVSTFCH